MKIVIAIPAFNEEKNIGPIILKLKKISENIIVCDDGSTDMTSEVAESLGAKVVKHSKNLGYGGAIKSLFLECKKMDVDIMITFDADGQHRIEDLEKLIEPIKNDVADIVIGSRFLDNETEIPKYRKIGVKAITKLTNVTGGMKISDSQSGLRAYNKKILQNLQLTESGMGISTEILIKAQKSNYRIKEVAIKILYEGKTSSLNPISHGSSVIFSTLKIVAIDRPLTFYGIPGIFFLIIGLIFVGWAIQGYVENQSIITNISLIGVGLTILGFLFLLTASILHSIVSIVGGRKID